MMEDTKINNICLKNPSNMVSKYLLFVTVKLVLS